MSDAKLKLEVMNGPLDGHVVTLENETKWSKEGEGPLIFPWDTELGMPQAHFFIDEGAWTFEGFKSQHGTYHNSKPIKEKVLLKKGDLLNASITYLSVSEEQ